jgi:hypothetical protein
MSIEMTITKWLTCDGQAKSYRIDNNKPYYIPEYGVWEVDEGDFEYVNESSLPSALRFAEGGPNSIRKLEYRLVENESEAGQ